MKKFFKFLITRTFILYLVAFGLAWGLFDVPQVKKNVQFKILNRFRLETVDYLVNFSKGKENLDQKKLKQYAFYYQKVSEYIPNRADAYGLLGFCYYYLGKKDKAIEAYEKALEINRSFFWFSYNLGMIHFKEGDYEKAYEIFKEAVRKKPQATVAYIQRSKRIYMPIIGYKVNHGVSIEKEMKDSYRQVYKLLAMLQQFFFNRPEFKEAFSQMDLDLALF